MMGPIFMIEPMMNPLRKLFDYTEMVYAFSCLLAIILPRQERAWVCYFEWKFLKILRKIDLTS